MMRSARAAPLALTVGEPAGVGGEIALKAWLLRRVKHVPAFFLIDDPDRLAALARRFALAVPLKAIAAPEDAAAVFPDALPLLPQALPRQVEPGRPAAENGAAVIASIARAVELAREGRAAAIVTNPIHKKSLYDAGFRHPGHTEFLAELAAVADPVMMLAVPGLRVVPVTIHMALAEALRQLDRRAIVHCGRVTADALQSDFGIAEPRLAVAGLNPHAGEEGRLGEDEAEMIAPAIAELRNAGIRATGPAAADTLFHPRARARYDAAICMYHDQALIPLKTIDFEHGVNITLGLPFVRTSPDHGTAFDIAGLGTASPESLIAALRLAADMAERRAARTPQRRAFA